MRPASAESERRYDIATFGMARLFGDLKAEFTGADAPVLILQFNPKLVHAGRDLGLRSIDAIGSDEAHEPIGDVDAALLEVRHHHRVAVNLGAAIRAKP